MFRLEFVLKKILQVITTLFAVATFNFLLFRVLPGDPVRLIARAGHLTPEAIARLRTTFGLDHPLPVQFLYYLNNLFHGELGFSFTYRRPVAEILSERITNTIILLAAATVIVHAYRCRGGSDRRSETGHPPGQLPGDHFAGFLEPSHFLDRLDPGDPAGGLRECIPHLRHYPRPGWISPALVITPRTLANTWCCPP